MAVGANLKAADAPAKLEGEKAKISYSLGMNVGRALKRQNFDVDVNLMKQAIEDVLGGKETLLTDQEATQVINDYRRNQAMKVQEKNKSEGDAFLAANAKKEGVVTTASGLQYIAMNTGSGPKPKATDRVKVHYRGTLIDGTEFDNSYKRGAPAEFALNGVIKGWTEVLQLMPVGSKWKVFIPSNLAYGPSGRPSIPPNSTLIFDIELIDIVKPEAKEAK